MPEAASQWNSGHNKGKGGDDFRGKSPPDAAAERSIILLGGKMLFEEKGLLD